MVSGVMERFKGKIKVGTLLLGSGGLVDSTTGIAAKAHVSQRVTLAVTAVANTDFTVSIPPGATLTSLVVYTGTAFTAGTDCKISAGISAGDASYVALQTVAAIGVVTLTLVAAAAATLGAFPAGSPNLFVRLVQTGTATAVGAATLVVNYVMV